MQGAVGEQQGGKGGDMKAVVMEEREMKEGVGLSSTR